MKKLKLNVSGKIPDAWAWILIIGFVLGGLNTLGGYVNLTSEENAIIFLAIAVLTAVLKIVEAEE